MIRHGEKLFVSVGWLATTAKEDRACYEDWAFLIEDGIVSDMGPRKDLSDKYSTTDKLALNEHIVCPGLINCHNHAVKLYARTRSRVKPRRLAPPSYLAV